MPPRYSRMSSAQGCVQILPVERLTRRSLPAYPGTDAGTAADFLAGRAAVAVGLIGPSPDGEAGVIGKAARESSRAAGRLPCGSRYKRARCARGASFVALF